VIRIVANVKSALALKVKLLLALGARAMVSAKFLVLVYSVMMLAMTVLALVLNQLNVLNADWVISVRVKTLRASLAEKTTRLVQLAEMVITMPTAKDLAGSALLLVRLAMMTLRVLASSVPIITTVKTLMVQLVLVSLVVPITNARLVKERDSALLVIPALNVTALAVMALALALVLVIALNVRVVSIVQSATRSVKIA